MGKLAEAMGGDLWHTMECSVSPKQLEILAYIVAHESTSETI